MEVWSLNLKGGGPVLGVGTRMEKGLAMRQSLGWRVSSADEALGFGRLLEVKYFPARRMASYSSGFRCFELRAANKKNNPENSSPSGNNDPSIPNGDGSEETNRANDKTESDDTTHRPQPSLSDWRDFRANLVIRGQVQVVDSDAPAKDVTTHEPTQQLGLKWAHPIPMPETGCVLVATEKLDGVRSFERSVVLLLRLGNRDPREGPFGVIINRPYNKKIRHMKQPNPDLATTFGDCSVHFGGPLDANMFLLTSRETRSLRGFEQVVPGISFGARNNLDEAIALVKKGILGPQDFKFFSGYAGWQFDQLIDEIESEYWVVAACSSYVIGGTSTESPGLWEEILQLMGGQYLELSRKPKQDSS
ncbi:putative transcriptional regulator protein [Dioscorea alata]|uniref:Transcriptional regulator protein n=1 Tax=Dioscorea alata TaxID=55571 RepID=A0ACB7VB81_DIOAL|nr:putative transcriptional regulator protein [Dioscorea alata]